MCVCKNLCSHGNPNFGPGGVFYCGEEGAQPDRGRIVFIVIYIGLARVYMLFFSPTCYMWICFKKSVVRVMLPPDTMVAEGQHSHAFNLFVLPSLFNCLKELV